MVMSKELATDCVGIAADNVVVCPAPSLEAAATRWNVAEDVCLHEELADHAMQIVSKPGTAHTSCTYSSTTSKYFSTTSVLAAQHSNTTMVTYIVHSYIVRPKTCYSVGCVLCKKHCIQFNKMIFKKLKNKS